ncbi:MAG: ABC transporter ATP-binding protein, partial [Acetobacteraceae bacterium]
AMSRIVAEGLRIEFPLYHLGARNLKKRILATTSRRMRTDSRNRLVIAALQDIGFTIDRGERVALVGHNGAGKTTLLRTLAGIYEPVAGRLSVQGTIGVLLDPAAGLDPLSTGRENIRLRALYLRLGAAETRAFEAAVESFADLGDFLDVPIHSYSAGMSIRLAFAMATAMRPSVLLMDEWIAAGDAAFMAKAQARLEALVREAEILVLATHSEAIVRRWCTRVLRLDSGRIVADGPPDEVLGALAAPSQPASAPA